MTKSRNADFEALEFKKNNATNIRYLESIYFLYAMHIILNEQNMNIIKYKIYIACKYN